AGEGSFQVHAGGAGSGLEGSGQRPPGAIHEPSSPALPVSRDRVQQQWRMERARRYARVLSCPGVLPNEFVSCLVRGRVFGAALGGLSVPRPATASSVRDDAGGPRRRENTNCKGPTRHTSAEFPWAGVPFPGGSQ